MICIVYIRVLNLNYNFYILDYCTKHYHGCAHETTQKFKNELNRYLQKKYIKLRKLILRFDIRHKNGALQKSFFFNFWSGHLCG